MQGASPVQLSAQPIYSEAANELDGDENLHRKRAMPVRLPGRGFDRDEESAIVNLQMNMLSLHEYAIVVNPLSTHARKSGEKSWKSFFSKKEKGTC